MPGNLVTLNRVHAWERWRLARECLSGKIAEKNSSEVGQRAQFPGREEAATDGTDLADAALERFVFLCTGHVPRFLATTDPRPMFRKPYWTRLSQITSRLPSFCREKIFLFWSIEKKKGKKEGKKEREELRSDICALIYDREASIPRLLLLSPGWKSLPGSRGWNIRLARLFHLLFTADSKAIILCFFFHGDLMASW